MSESLVVIAERALWLGFDAAGDAAADVDGATTWTDCLPGRRDLPRTLPDAQRLTIVPVAGDDWPPGGLRCTRTPRPGQGRLTGNPTIGLVVVLISPTRPDLAQDLRDWGDFVHLNHIAAAGVPGYTMITPYDVDAPGRSPRFLHLYELDAADPEATFQAMTPLVRSRLPKAEFRAWAWHPALQIDYVSTFRSTP